MDEFSRAARALVPILEAILLAAGRPLSLMQLGDFFPDASRPGISRLREGLSALEQGLAGRGIELVQVASGYRLQVRAQYSGYIARMQAEKPQRYSRALLETLVLIAYRQPITRSEIEDVRGVGVSTQIMRTLIEREWIRVVGHREVPGRPGLYATTRQFLDYFNLKSLDQLPPLAEIRDLDALAAEIGLELDVDAAVTPGAALVQPDEAGREDQDERAEQFFAELDQLEEQLPDNFEALLKGHFAAESDSGPDAEPESSATPEEALAEQNSDVAEEASATVPRAGAGRSLFGDD